MNLYKMNINKMNELNCLINYDYKFIIKNNDIMK